VGAAATAGAAAGATTAAAGGRPGAAVGGGLAGVTAPPGVGTAAAEVLLSAGVADENPGRDPLGDGAAACCEGAAAPPAAARGSLVLPSFAPSLKPHHMKLLCALAPRCSLK
ncbi:unnamed protein product, partial [Ectocarpus fasciculatus]